jgi:hypothetical protein
MHFLAFIEYRGECSKMLDKLFLCWKNEDEGECDWNGCVLIEVTNPFHHRRSKGTSRE